MGTVHCEGFLNHFPIDCHPHQSEQLSPTVCQGVLQVLPIDYLISHSETRLGELMLFASYRQEIQGPRGAGTHSRAHGAV